VHSNIHTNTTRTQHANTNTNTNMNMSKLRQLFFQFYIGHRLRFSA